MTDKEFKVIDLTHPLSETIPTWDGACGFGLAIDRDYTDFTGPHLFRVQRLTCGAGSGTHMDAPAHVVPGGLTIDKLDLRDLVTDCIVIDVSAEADENYMVMPAALEQFEKEHGEIAPRSFVIFSTGWDKNWGSREKYHNNHMFPSVHLSAAEIL